MEELKRTVKEIRDGLKEDQKAHRIDFKTRCPTDVLSCTPPWMRITYTFPQEA